jgi:diguanylate cyclase (GGDEF)-like protein
MRIARDRRWAGVGLGRTGPALARLRNQLARERGARRAAERRLANAAAALAASEAELERRVGERTAALERDRSRALSLAQRDLLTGLANRDGYLDQLAAAFEAARARAGTLALLLIDLDRFKQINDTLGHAAGDAVLIETARRLRQACRRQDLPARLGGDEFAVIAALDGPPAAAAELAGRIVAAIAAPHRIEDQLCSWGCSIGIALFPDHGRTIPDLQKAADLALYKAKGRGRGRHELYEPGLLLALAERRRLEDELQAALAAGQIEVWYRPRRDLRRGGIAALAAELRWQGADGTWRPPDLLARTARVCGLTEALAELALRAACRDARPWVETGRLACVSCGLPLARPGAPELAALLQAVLAEAGLPGPGLELRIPEALLLEDTASTRRLLERLQGLGVRCLLDQLGAGYSRPALLHELPWHGVELDPGLSAALPESPAAVAVAGGLAALARHFGRPVVAGGIARPAQLERLRGLGCDLGHGALLGEAVPASALAALLAPRAPPRPGAAP